MNKPVKTMSCIILDGFPGFSVSARGKGREVDNIRKPRIAGTWYPGDPAQLRSDIEGYLADAREGKIDEKVVGIVAPHAGYVYSGQVAACAYRAVQNTEFDAVIVIGPSHRAYFKGASIYDGEGYETPLGVMPVDTPLAEEIASCSNGVVSLVSDDSSPENSIEIQIPFLQTVFGNIPFVPMLMGTQDVNTCRKLADAIIKAVGDKRMLVVASSDFSHYHGYAEAVGMDLAALGHIETMNIEGFLRGLEKGRYEACGAGAVIVTIMIARAVGADRGRMLKYMNSGDVTGDKNGVVGYAAVIFY